MAKEKEEPVQVDRKTVKRAMLGLGLVLLVIVSAAMLLVYKSDKAPSLTSQEPVVGILDMQALISLHKEYPQLQALESEVVQLQAALYAQSVIPAFTSENNAEVSMDETADQRAKFDQLIRHSELRKELTADAERIRQEMAPEFSAEQDALNKPYLNELLNLRIKMDNAQVLGLSEETVKDMEESLNSLQTERQGKLQALLADQNQRLIAEQRKQSAGKIAKVEAEDAQASKTLQNAALSQELSLQDRNNKAMEQALTPIQQRLSMARKTALLETKKLALAQLQDKIYRDIAGRAAKLAIIHHLTLILAQPTNDSINEKGNLNQLPGVAMPVIGINTIDLTEEMKQEISTL